MSGKTMIEKIGVVLMAILSLPALLIRMMKRLAIEIATRRWHWFGFIPCSAGLWPLGLYCWDRSARRWHWRFLLRLFSYACFIVGTFLFFAGLWRFAATLFFIRFLLWIDVHFCLSAPLPEIDPENPPPIFSHFLDKLSVLAIGLLFLVFAINKERMLDATEPSDNYYHMAVAQQILKQHTIPVWDDWEFAPMGRPHLYPPLLHLAIAYFSGAPDRVETAFTNIVMLLYPAAMFSYWFSYRYFLGAPWAYLSLLFLSMEMIFSMGCLLGLPASVVNVLWPWILLALERKKTYLAMFLLAAAFYTHTGMPVLICLCLLAYGIWRRQHFLRAAAVIAGALILAAPWLVRYYVFSDWMQSGGAEGFSLSSILARLLALQIVNPLFLLLLLHSWFRCHMRELAVFRSQAIGFLPMLTQYGGRYFMHGAPFLSPFVAHNFLRFLPNGATRRRALGLFLITLIPLPAISFMGANDSTKPHLFPNLSASHFVLFLTVNRGVKDHSGVDRLVEAIKENSSPKDILHLPDLAPHFADLLALKTSRRTDMGGWGEVRKPAMWEEIAERRKDLSDGLFVVSRRESIPAGRQIMEVSPYYLGLPAPVIPSATETSQ
ncbi:MAG: hypothetical protein AB1656_18585 [Candidatus Omnitrophota bacterium]